MSKSEKPVSSNRDKVFGNDNPNALEVIDLKKVYSGRKTIEEVKAVDGVSFSVNKGEIFGLLGPNGAGKTTTINILCGLLKQTEGEVYVGGYNIKKLL